MIQKASNKYSDHLAPSQTNGNEPIAIIGIGCRFPGSVNKPNQFWKLLVDEVDAITEIPANRVDTSLYYDPVPGTPGKMATTRGGFVDHMDEFDATFFGISPREVDLMDPQQRLLLETAWEALENAGQAPDKLVNSLTGVYVGMWINDYTDKMYKTVDDINLYITTGGGRYAASGRLSFFFGFQGPSITLDTACSSSLVTVHLACQSLRSGESNLALAGGANIILEPTIYQGYSRSNMLSPDGRCKFGDARANGYVRSEGIGLVVLKRLSDAIADNDRIYAVIRGSAVNNDGRSSELLVMPGVGSQARMLRQAYQNAGVDPARVGYVEAHGTGTLVGDPVELESLASVFSENRDPARICRVGSVKTNIGHTEGAAGVAGLIKVALSLQHRQIPASLHFQTPNPKISWADLPLEIPTKLTPWPEDMLPAVGAVSAFGITGTNAHIVLEEYRSEDASLHQPDETVSQSYILPLSAQSHEALRDLVSAYRELLDGSDAPALNDLCYTAAVRRGHLPIRLAVTGDTSAELAVKLADYLQQEAPETGSVKFDGEAKVTFVFPGQGGQWLGMGRELMQRSLVFRETILRCEEACRKWTDWSLLKQLALDENSSDYRLNEIGVIQPTLFAMEIALAELWRSWGLEPAAVIGHSMGEVAAAYVAGALSLDDAMRVICKRSQLMQRTSGQGAMAVIGLPFTEAEAEIRAAGFEDRLSIAVQNSPRSVVISGSPAALDTLIETLRARDIFCRHVKVDVASHSPQMDPLRPELVEALHGIQPQPSRVPFYSTVMQAVCAGEELDADYWGKNLRVPVRFSGTTQLLLEEEHTVFIEMSPHPILLAAVDEVAREAGHPALTCASMRRDQPELLTMLGQLGALYQRGYAVDWAKLYPAGEVVTLPSYPWQRERYWMEESTARTARPGAHPLLGQYVQSAAGEHIWETPVSTKTFPYLGDHRVRGSAVFPAAGYVEMALGAAAEVFGNRPVTLQEITYSEAFFLSEAEKSLQLIFTPTSPEVFQFHFYSRAAQEDASNAWTLHAAGEIAVAPSETPVPPFVPADLLNEREPETSSAEFYTVAAARGLDYGENFQTIAGAARSGAVILARIQLPEEVTARASKYRLHPVLVDAAFQALLFGLPQTNQETYLPLALDEFQSHAAPRFDEALWCCAVPRELPNGIRGDIYLFNSGGELVLSASGFHMQMVAARATDEALFYVSEWVQIPPAVPAQTQPRNWLIFADCQGEGQALAQALQSNGQDCTLVLSGAEYRCLGPNRYEIDPYQPAHYAQLLAEGPQPVSEIVHCWSLNADSVVAAADPNLISILYLVQAAAAIESVAAPRLILVTRGAQVVNGPSGPISVQQSPVWGLGAVIANELPNLRCARIDLSPNSAGEEAALLAQELLSIGEEDQIALRNLKRYAARLKPDPAAGETLVAAEPRLNNAGLPFRVEATEPGIIDRLALKPSLRTAPDAGQVEIAVKATGLNFMNVMAALGMLPGYANGVGPLGIECAGVITRVGDGVEGLQPGDEVAAIAFNSLSSHAVADARLVVKKPAFLSFAEAASIPIVYVTAYYALHELGRLRAGERVLIHSAAGGVGQAALQLARRAGAEIFATAGSPEKRSLLAEMGIRHIFNSRSLEFANEILAATGGEGVDAILNSLAGSAITRGLEILRPYGRFMEIGKRDIYGNSKIGLLTFQKNLSFFAIDLDRMSRERPDMVGSMLREIFHLIESGELTALPVQAFPVSQVREAFRTMAQAKHIGKIVITMDDPTAELEMPAGLPELRADAAYLITGGLGDLGLTFARWLAQYGARHLVLLGRREPSPAAQEAVAALREAGVSVVTAQADVTDRSALAEVVERVNASGLAVRGVIHAAGLLADSTLQQMDRQRFEQALAPKALGAWNLHESTLDQPLDFFILFSSVAAVLGTPGQANYAAGNAFLDGLAHYRRASGLPALSINWGPWSEIGLANQQANRGERLTGQGLLSITPEQGIRAMAAALGQDNPQISVMRLDARKWCEAQPAAARSSLLRELQAQAGEIPGEKKPAGKNARRELLAAEAGRPRATLFESLLREQVAQVLGLPAARIPSDRPLKTLGLDSLMSIELVNRLERALEVSLSSTLIWNYPTIAALVPALADKMSISLEAQVETTAAPAAQSPTAGSVESELDVLDKDELEALLADELSAIDDALKGSGYDTEA